MRPKEWDELRLEYRRVDISEEVYNAYEAGADAYEEALKKNGEAMHFNCDDSCSHQKGWRVFIEDDDVT